jgi:hypothetical protein
MENFDGDRQAIIALWINVVALVDLLNETHRSATVMRAINGAKTMSTNTNLGDTARSNHILFNLNTFPPVDSYVNHNDGSHEKLAKSWRQQAKYSRDTPRLWSREATV